MATYRRFSVPANLLIGGEYLITREGGCGLAVAVEPRAYCEVSDESAGDVEVTAVTGSGREQLPGRSGTGLVPQVLAAVEELTGRSVLPSHILLDTAAFFDPDTGHKLGLGSSAAATVLLTAALLERAGHDPIAEREAVVRCAIMAHRRAHAGRGSGYDIATSALGGWVAFTGGDEPAWTQSPLDRLAGRLDLSLHGWNHGRPVRSSAAVERFDEYLGCDHDATRAMIEENNRIIGQLEEARDWQDIFRAVEAARRFGERIGEAIGVSAGLDLATHHPDDGWIAKASGAGNERAIAVSLPQPRRRLPRVSQPLTLAPEGLRSEPARGDA